jgi:hypothetical protein
MCNPAIAMVGLAVASSIAQKKAADDAATAQNAAAAQTQMNANIVANQQYTQAGARHAQQVHEAQNMSYDASLEKNAAVALGRAAAGSSGVSGISVDALLASENNKGERNLDKLHDRMDYSTVEYLNNVNSIHNEARGRIDAAPMTSGPDMGSFLLTTAFKAGSSYFAAGGSVPGIGGGGTSLPTPGETMAFTGAGV